MSPPRAPAPPVVREATPADLDALVAGNAAMALESEGLALDLVRLRAGVAALLADSSKGRYLVADAGGRIAGQLMVTTEWSDWRNAWFWWIQSVHVEAAFRRQGVYRALHRECERRALEAGACGLRLYVDRANEGAQATYRSLGMTLSHYDLYETSFSGAPSSLA